MRFCKANILDTYLQIHYILANTKCGESVYLKCHFVFFICFLLLFFFFLINWNAKLEIKFWFLFLYWSWDIKHKTKWFFDFQNNWTLKFKYEVRFSFFHFNLKNEKPNPLKPILMKLVTISPHVITIKEYEMIK